MRHYPFGRTHCFVLIKRSDIPCKSQFCHACYLWIVKERHISHPTKTTLQVHPHWAITRMTSNEDATTMLTRRVLTTHATEPSFKPKVQDLFADFPNIRYSNFHKLLTFETWCGNQYRLPQTSLSWQIFMVQKLNPHTQKRLDAFRSNIPLLCKKQFQGSSAIIRRRELRVSK